MLQYVTAETLTTKARNLGTEGFPVPRKWWKDRNEPNMNLFLCELLTNIATTKD